MRKTIPYLLMFLITVSFLMKVFEKKEIYLQPYDASYWQVRYEESGWAKGWEQVEPIGDAELYAYAGWRQIQGDDPTKINAEMPPLGKYFLGLSILLFKNQYFASLIFGVLFLLLTFFISQKMLLDLSWSLIPVFLLSLDGLFREDLATSMLDLPFAVFVTLSVYFLLKGRESPRWYPALAVSLAAVSATKMYLAGFALTGVITLYLIFLLIVFRYKDILWFLLSLSVFLIVYFGSYAVYFFNNHNLWDFKYLHFWVRHFARVQVTNYPPLEILRILYLGQWKTWWGGSGVVTVQSWNPLWTAGGILAPLAGIFGLLKNNLDLLVLSLWIMTFLGMYSFGIPYPRYLLPILPAIYILLVSTAKRLVELKVWKVSRNIKH